ncbi:hypothetical protein FPRO05_05696 [Fusarium proliferatum]|uniref:C2H2-type domain-containing protein n=1 Tax=Gibberella intermedia TaxID=948311 RepID=A0A365MMI2_GIBIN|nr:hypothetical protein FPRO05_05696 [Fusarium proliferatum]
MPPSSRFVLATSFNKAFAYVTSIMKHRPVSHHSFALQRYLDEPASLQERLLAASGSDRKKFYVDSHEPQLRTVREDVSRREPSQVERFPFVCVFHYEGCHQKFENKRDWKDHVVSQHLQLSRVFWECTERSCTHTEWTHQQSLFANKHDFRTHLIQYHQPSNCHDEKNDITFLVHAEVQLLLDCQDSSMRMLCGLPENLGCPMPQCASVRFTGPTAWDQRLNHAAEHFLTTSPQCKEVFGGGKDAELVQWASRNRVGVYQEVPNVCLRQHDSDKSVADSGYSSMPGLPQRPNLPLHGDSSPASSSKVPGRTSDATFNHRSVEELYLSAEPVGIGGWVQDQEYLEPMIDEESVSSAYQSSQEILSQHESIEDHDTVVTSQSSVSSDASNGAPDGSRQIAAVMQWFHGWFGQWLAPLTQQRPSGNSSQSTTSQSQTGSDSSTQEKKKEKEAARPRRDQKRKRGNGGEDDGNEESSKSQRVDGGSNIRMFACPYFKRNPRKYGQPKWKSCAHPGYRDIHRVK